jgi:oxygen-dependent protoporphyrinogen oxidase
MANKAQHINKNQRIAIIGAGPGGLSMAEALREQGYQHITLFEARDRVGGMALSHTYKDESGQEVIYELGSVQPFGSKKLFKLFEKYNIHTGKKEVGDKKPLPIRMYCLNERKFVVDFLHYKLGLPLSQSLSILSDVYKLFSELYKYRRLAKPGFADMRYSKELGMPAHQWLGMMHLQLLHRTLNVLLSGPLNGSAYDYKDQHSAADAIKYLLQGFKTPRRYVNGHYVPVTEGYQSIWLAVAKQQHILLNAHIEKITRTAENITIKLQDNSEHQFDKLIVACPAIKLLNVLDVDESEKNIFNKMQFVGGWKIAFTAKNLPHDGLYVFIDQMENQNQRPIAPGFIPEGEAGNGKWLYTSMVGLNKTEGIDEAIDASIAIYKDHFGATDIEIIEKRFWEEYKCHFIATDVRNGIFDHFEALQGHKHTYYCGEQLSSSSNGMVVDYSYDLVDRFFTVSS